MHRVTWHGAYNTKGYNMIVAIEDYNGNTICRLQIDGSYNYADEDKDAVTGEQVIRLQSEVRGG